MGQGLGCVRTAGPSLQLLTAGILTKHNGYMIEVGQSTGLLEGRLAKKRPEDLPG